MPSKTYFPLTLIKFAVPLRKGFMAPISLFVKSIL